LTEKSLNEFKAVSELLIKHISKLN